MTNAVPQRTGCQRRHGPGNRCSAVLRYGAVLCALILLGLAVAPASAALADPQLFGMNATRRDGTKPFPKWQEALQRYLKERQKFTGECRDQGPQEPCPYKAWYEFIGSLRGKSAGAQLTAINTYMNRYPYVLDEVNWGVKDYWETPGQFFSKHGDCEDYAIAKYLTLRALGWGPEMLRVVILQDLNLNVPHAILAVHISGKTFILDNQISMVVEDSRIKHYRPIYSVNEKNWWRYSRPR